MKQLFNNLLVAIRPPFETNPWLVGYENIKCCQIIIIDVTSGRQARRLS